MNVKVKDLMVKQVVSAPPETTVAEARKLMEEKGFHALPVLDSEDRPLGIITSHDLLADVDPASPISELMTEKVYTVNTYDDAHVPARVMRNHRIHRVIVTHEKKVVGILSAYDLLKLVEDHRYVAKNPPTKSKRKGSKRQ